MRIVRETCSRCPSKLLNPTWQTKYCPSCKKVVQREQSDKKNKELSEQARLRRIAEGITERKRVNPFFLCRGEIGIHGGKLFG